MKKLRELHPVSLPRSGSDPLAKIVSRPTHLTKPTSDRHETVARHETRDRSRTDSGGSSDPRHLLHHQQSDPVASTNFLDVLRQPAKPRHKSDSDYRYVRSDCAVKTSPPIQEIRTKHRKQGLFFCVLGLGHLVSSVTHANTFSRSET